MPPDTGERTFGWIAHKDGRWHTLIANQGFTPAEIRRDLGELAAKGLTITAYPDRASYLAALDSLEMWDDANG